METPLTPLEFARRARKLYPDRVAVIDGDSRWTYAQFLDRCDRWSAVLQTTRNQPARPRCLSLTEHSRAARIVLCGPADRRCAGAVKLSPDRRRLRLPDQS